MQIASSIAAMQQPRQKMAARGHAHRFRADDGLFARRPRGLVKRAQQAVGKNGKVVVSIYVNPTQFGPTEDLLEISARLETRFEITARIESGCHVHAKRRRNVSEQIWKWDSALMCRRKLSQTMEGASRPTHFRGVTTIVAKLFNIVLPDVAVFGQKILSRRPSRILQTRMVCDLNFPVKIIIAANIA